MRAMASQSLRDVYEAMKYFTCGENLACPRAGRPRSKWRRDRPHAAGSKALLVDETAAAGLHDDPELLRLGKTLKSLLAAVDAPSIGDVHVNGDGNRVQVAGSIVNTERHVSRNTITPDERHVTPSPSAELRRVITEVADRMADDSGAPNFAAVHRMLQRRVAVASYLLIPRKLFVDALTFLKQVRGRHRRALRRRQPAAFEADLFRAIMLAAGNSAGTASVFARSRPKSLVAIDRSTRCANSAQISLPPSPSCCGARWRQPAEAHQRPGGRTACAVTGAAGSWRIPAASLREARTAPRSAQVRRVCAWSMRRSPRHACRV